MQASKIEHMFESYLLSAGSYGVPKKQAVDTAISAMTTYFHANTSSNVQDVYLVDTSAEPVVELAKESMRQNNFNWTEKPVEGM